MFRSSGLIALGFLLFSGAAWAQPDPIPVTASQAPMAQVPFLNVSVVVPGEGAPLLNVHVHGANVMQVLNTISERGNLQIAANVDKNATLAALSLDLKSPEEALAGVCEAAHLSCEVHNGVWFVMPSTRKVALKADSAIIDDLNFREVDAPAILALISQSYNIHLMVDGDVKGRITFIRLNHKTPREAIAFAANCTVRDDNGTLRISAKPGA
jgi:hypothetical protein